MPRTPYLSTDIKRRMVDLFNDNETKASIARIFKVCRSTVTRVLKSHSLRGTVAAAPKTGRPRKTTARMDKKIVRLSKKMPFLTASAIRNYLNIMDVSTSTIKSRLRDSRLHERRPARKPLVSKKNKTRRLKFAKYHESWTPQQWEKILWSDESKFNLFGSDGKVFVRRPDGARFDPKYQLPTVKHGGGNVMVWGCFSRSGVGPIHRIDGIMDKHVYKAIMKDVMLPFARRNMRRRWVYQQDNDPKHTAKVVEKWFKSKRVSVLEWPAQSPDFNPIEHHWDEVQRRIGERKFSNKDALFAALKEIWENIPKGVRQGDTISPQLFTACLCETLNSLNWQNKGININGCNLSHLAFTEGVVIISHSNSELCHMVKELAAASLQDGIKINIRKTKLLANCCSGRTPIKICGEEIEKVNEFVYLGKLISFPCDHVHEIRRRIQAGWNAFRKYRHYLTSQKIAMKHKRRLFNMCIVPSILYGAENLGINKGC
uniref:Transposase n=1 Tax=Plectus sambesii TaxID=2011161 RepID=A0A914WGH2_9BILA